MTTIGIARKVVALAGPIASGKSTFAELLAVAAGGSVLSFGRMVRAQSTASRRSDLHRASAELISRLGYEGLVELLLEEMDGKSVQVIEGVRNRAVAEILKRRFGSALRLLYLDAPMHVRHNRALARNAGDETANLDQFAHQETADIESGVEELRSLADQVILNTGSLDSLAQTATQLARELSNQPMPS